MLKIIHMTHEFDLRLKLIQVCIVESTGQYAARSFFRLWIEECLCNILIKIEENTALLSLSMGNRIVSFQQPSKYSKGPF